MTKRKKTGCQIGGIFRLVVHIKMVAAGKSSSIVSIGHCINRSYHDASRIDPDTYFDGIFAGQSLLALLVPEDEEGSPELVEGEAADRRHLVDRPDSDSTEAKPET